MKDQTQQSVISCLDLLERKYKSKFKKIFKTITCDNGSEFLDFASMEKLLFSKHKKRTQVYYCHPHCSCERGTNERMNREIRRLVPKGKDLSNYTTAQVKDIETWVNTYPNLFNIILLIYLKIFIIITPQIRDYFIILIFGF